jgi:hypothetical protein
VFLEKKSQDYLRDLRILPIFAPKFMYLRAGEAKKHAKVCPFGCARLSKKHEKEESIYSFLV